MKKISLAPVVRNRSDGVARGSVHCAGIDRARRRRRRATENQAAGGAGGDLREGISRPVDCSCHHVAGGFSNNIGLRTPIIGISIAR